MANAEDLENTALQAAVRGALMRAGASAEDVAELEIFQSLALLKPPGGREKPWHQDNAYFNVDGDAVNAHLANAVPIVGQMLDGGAVSLDQIEFHGPAAEIPKYKEAADALGALYYEVDATFSRIAC